MEKEGAQEIVVFLFPPTPPLRLAQKSLEHTVSVLHTTKDKLHEKKVEVLQKGGCDLNLFCCCSDGMLSFGGSHILMHCPDACLSERERVEALLMEEALSLKSNLQTSIQDIEGFTAKIGEWSLSSIPRR